MSWRELETLCLYAPEKLLDVEHIGDELSSGSKMTASSSQSARNRVL